MKFPIQVKVFPENIKKFLFHIFICLVLIMIGLALLQNYLLYQPSTYGHESLKKFAREEGFSLWPAETDYRGLLAEPKGVINGTAVVVHGNAGSAIDRTWYADPLRALGYQVILLEYPGYGSREGRPSEKVLVGDVRESIKLARDQFGPPILLIGESLGSAVAAEAAGGLDGRIEGLVLCTPWNDLASVAQSIYWFLPVKLFVREKYDSVANLKNFHRSIMLVVAGTDELIPAECSRRLFESLGPDKKIRIIPGAGHNTWQDRVDTDWWKILLHDTIGK
jgi:uncharacterized protein